MPKIHPLAFVDPKARVADDVEVGPFCVIGPDVILGAGNKLIAHVVLNGITTIGQGNVFHPNAVIGGAPQDKKYKGAATKLSLGDNNQIREHVTIHCGTEKGGGITRLGSNNLLMVNAHIGHDAQFGDNNVISNNVMIAGHVVCGSNVSMMGGVGVHHFVSIGDFAYIGGYAKISHDVPPFCKVDGSNQIRGLNAIGLRRAGYTEADIEALEDACRTLFYKDKPLALAMKEFHAGNGINLHVKRMVEFLERRNAGKNGRYLESQRTA